MKKNTSRFAACQVLHRVLTEGASFNPKLLTPFRLSTQDHTFATHLCFGVLRFYYQLEAFISRTLHRPLKTKDFDIQLLMMIGLFELQYGITPHYAAIHATVQTCRGLKKPWAAAVVNSCLRAAQRAGEILANDASLEASTNHPKWLINQIQKAWPNDWESITNACAVLPPFVLRVNQQKVDRDAYLKMLSQANIEATPAIFNHIGIFVKNPVNVELLPGFTQGLCSVQDGAAQLATPLLDLQPQMRILDACAAPGGKMAHILESAPGLDLLAMEIDADRFTLLESTLKRLELSATLLHQDASSPQDWWDNKPFDRILLDAPCSGTGVIRRHPDIKFHRQRQDLVQLVAIQAALLTNLWPLLKPGGLLLYITCSILPEENTEQIAQFLSTHQDAKELPFVLPGGISLAHGQQILPGVQNMDGFYYARLLKI